MTAEAGFRADLLGAIPRLRAFAASLAGNPDRADDLVQETLVKALANPDGYAAGTNLLAWLFTVLRNIYYSEFRKRRREVPDPEGKIAGSLATAPAQGAHMDFLDFRAAFALLRPDQREALVLVGASGMSYDDAARVCGCAAGTMKSRVNRARNRLAKLLMVASPGDIGREEWPMSSLETTRRLSRTGTD